MDGWQPPGAVETSVPTSQANGIRDAATVDSGPESGGSSIQAQDRLAKLESQVEDLRRQLAQLSGPAQAAEDLSQLYEVQLVKKAGKLAPVGEPAKLSPGWTPSATAAAPAKEDGAIKEKLAKEKKRDKLLDGLPKIEKSASQSQTRKLAMLRSLVNCLVFSLVTGGLIIPIVVDISIADSFEVASTRGVISFCDDGSSWNAPVLQGPTALLEILQNGQNHRVRFRPRLHDGSGTSIPDLEYYDSEDWKALLPNKHKLLSFGLFPLHSQEVGVDLANTSCYFPPEVSEAETTRLNNDFGAAIARTMEAAQRRRVGIAPSAGLVLNRVHGAILLQRSVPDDDHMPMFDPVTERFGMKFYHSPGWTFYACMLGILLFVVTLELGLLVGRFAQQEMKEQLRDLCLQYDYLWEMMNDENLAKDPSMRDMLESAEEPDSDDDDDELSTDEKKAAFLASSREDQSLERAEQGGDPATTELGKEKTEHTVILGIKPKHRRSAFRSWLQACTPHFMIDHLVGNVETCSDDTQLGLTSASLHGLALGLWPAALVVCATMFPDVRFVALGVILVHWCCGTCFGMLYYFSVSFKTRRWLLWSMLACLGFIGWASCVYIGAVFLFFVVQVVAHPEETAALFLLIATPILYPILAWPQLQRMRTIFKKAKKQTGSNKGRIAKHVERLQLTTSMIVIGLIGTTVTLLLAAVLLFCSMAVYKGQSLGDNLGALVPAIAVPVTSFVRHMRDINSRRADIEARLNSGVSSAQGVLDQATRLAPGVVNYGLRKADARLKVL